MIPLVDLKRNYRSIKKEIDDGLKDVIDNTAFIMGPNVDNFEKEFARFCGARHCISVANGTVALEVALKALGIGPGDEVIIPTLTFIATAEAVNNVGASVQFVDVDDKTFTIDISTAKVNPNTKAIIPVHLYGQPCDMDAIIDFAGKNNLAIVEDCAQAHAAEYKSKKVPVTSIGCFSFYPGKNLGAFGDAGAVVTDDDDIYNRISVYRDHGRNPGEKYTHHSVGSNIRMDALQARVLSIKLKHLKKWSLMRSNNAKIYKRELGCGPYEAKYAKHVYHLFVIRSARRDDLLKHLKKNGVGAGIHYPIPLHLQPAYSNLGFKEGDFPVAELACKEILSLPMFPELTEDEIKQISQKVKEFENND
jgi:dTDP-4-amino-4,6-dideoxygalactose transaminase